MNITTSEMRMKGPGTVTLDNNLLRTIQDTVNKINRQAKEKRERARRQRARRKKQIASAE